MTRKLTTLVEENTTEATLTSTSRATVICGANSITDELTVGMSVADIRSGLRDILNIPEGAAGILDGTPVAENKVIGRDQTLEFVRHEGREKG